MKAKVKKVLNTIAQKLPNSRLLLIITAGIILALIAYITILLTR